jgi:monoamine oxidase
VTQSACSCDVAVIGAGAAGLAAATELATSARSVLVLEARSRAGGRILTCHEPDLSYPLELGAEFVHGAAARTLELLSRARIATARTAGTRWTVRDGRLHRADDIFDDVHRLMQHVDSLEEADLSMEDFLERHATDPGFERARVYARMMVEGFDAADPRRASVRAIAHEWSGGPGGAERRPMGGYGTLIAELDRSYRSSGNSLELDTVVRSVHWTRGSVRIEAMSKVGPLTVTARRALVTLPISLFDSPPDAPGSVRFEPAIGDKVAAARGLALGPVVKVLLRFRRPFWESCEEGRYRGAGFVHAPGAVFPTLWTALPEHVPLLTLWAGGPRAAALSGLSRDQLLERALAAVQDVFGARAQDELSAAFLHDWQGDPFARGAYSYVTVGGGDAPRRLALPLADTLYFAGEATCRDSMGTVEAALQSGTRAAREIGASLAAD